MSAKPKVFVTGKSCLSVSAVTEERSRIHGIHIGNIAFSRTDQGYPAASRTSWRIKFTFGP